MKKKYTKLSILAWGIFLFAFTFTVVGAESFFGSATMEDGSVKIVSNTGDADTTNDFGGIVLDLPASTTVAELSSLSTDFNVTDDDCKAGSPRFQLRLDTDNDGDSDGNAFIYLGPTPNFTECPENTWISSGDLTESTDERVDLSQLGGDFYSTYEELVEDFGDATILSVSLVVDSGWAFEDNEQTVLIDNVSVNGTTYDFTPRPTSANQCKKDGWKTYTNPAFKNQGECVSSISKAKTR